MRAARACCIIISMSLQVNSDVSMKLLMVRPSFCNTISNRSEHTNILYVFFCVNYTTVSLHHRFSNNLLFSVINL